MAENKEKYYEIEQLDEKQLNGVSGGNFNELSLDRKELSKMGLCNAYDVGSLSDNIKQRNEILGAWKKAGVEVVMSNYGQNQYYIDGEKVTRVSALNYVRKNRRR
jgi:hypothetical protein